MSDLRYAVRFALRNRGLSLTIALTLTLAIGVATAMFAIVQAVLLNPLGVPDPARVVSVWEARTAEATPRRTVSQDNVTSWKGAARTIESIGVWRDWGMRLAGANGPEPILAAIASPELFTVLRSQPVIGRVFTDDDLVPGRNTVAVLSHRAWRSRFNADPAVIGRTLTLSRAPSGPRVFTVVGVLPPDPLPSMADYELWAPVTIDPDYGAGRGLRNRRALARLAASSTIDAARTELAGVAASLEREFPESNAGWTVAMTSLADAELGAVRPTLLLFSGAIVMLVLIGCANVAGLLLARAMGRTRELGIRMAVGATRGRIVRLLLAESLLLSALGAAGGAVAAGWFLTLFARYGPTVPRAADIALQPSAWACAAALAVLTGLLSALAPVLHFARWELSDSVRTGGRAFLAWPAARLRGALVAGEIALALVLVVGAAMTLRGLDAMLSTPLGIDPDNLIVFQVFPSADKYPERPRLVSLYGQVAEELRRVPGVTHVGAVSAGPLFGGEETDQFSIVGAPPPDPRDAPRVRFFDADGAYFATMGMRQLAGRTFAATDSASAQRVAVVNEAFVRRYLPNGAVGRQVIVNQVPGVAIEIVGVVSDLRHGLDPAAPPIPEIYWPQTQRARWATYFVVRSAIPPASVVPALRETLRQVDADLVPSRIATIQQMIDRGSRQPRFQSWLLGVFAAFALLLCVTGLYGLVSYAVGQRTREIALRVSLGASRAGIARLVLMQGGLAAAAGIGLGLVAALAFARFVSAVLVGVAPFDPWSFGLAATVLAAATLLACAAPLRRAARIDPAIALKVE